MRENIGIIQKINYLSERGTGMWERILCPKCGVRLEMDIVDFSDTIICTQCFEKFTLPYDARVRLEEKDSEEFAMAGFASPPHLDSSFWIS
jgi:hypothetical protein